MKQLILVFILIAVGGIIFLKLGRSVYVPVVQIVKGKETVESIENKLSHLVLDRLQLDFVQAGFKDFPAELVLVGLKQEALFQVYGKSNNVYKFIKEYPFTATSGQLGPKLKEGDRQIPEGIYEVEYLNPNSSYHLSLKINYPNEFDKTKSKRSQVKEMGGDIFIHGKSVTIGCIPIGDEGIEEVFIMANKARKNTVKVIISPKDFRLDQKYPSIETIDWEDELYSRIAGELMGLPVKG